MIQAPITKCDMGVQTELHPIEMNLVKTYEWNEWELRRKAIRLVRFIFTSGTDLACVMASSMWYVRKNFLKTYHFLLRGQEISIHGKDMHTY